MGNDVNLYLFPSPKMWPLDGGRYIGTADVVITKDPEDGTLNVGTYRQMVHSRNEVGFYVSPGKDAQLHRENGGRWANRVRLALPMELTPFYSCWDPLVFQEMYQSTTMPGGYKEPQFG